jgi:hypothetical protein
MMEGNAYTYPHVDRRPAPGWNGWEPPPVATDAPPSDDGPATPLIDAIEAAALAWIRDTSLQIPRGAILGLNLDSYYTLRGEMTAQGIVYWNGYDAIDMQGNWRGFYKGFRIFVAPWSGDPLAFALRGGGRSRPGAPALTGGPGL